MKVTLESDNKDLVKKVCRKNMTKKDNVILFEKRYNVLYSFPSMHRHIPESFCLYQQVTTKFTFCLLTFVDLY